MADSSMNGSPIRYKIVCENCTQSNPCSMFFNFAIAYDTDKSKHVLI
ncbi:hypothetical protein Awo_c33820 [Acetobacterium woodii DSM 1030]|uniref:Uncharacterized protein n=1 Tax=Acetobacterium woodii (strain ATCC 29683 / DSM 1030 / JCM 2381 / KCTC 1655 / WB1) TaxID=931626 RepID=H6LL01_ACEWD|nr:hypothetical protein Awo_c33820 [Acetobacterium woodii DSM 1030]